MENTVYSVLLLLNNTHDYSSLCEVLLHLPGFRLETETCSSLREGLKKIAKSDYFLVLLDLDLPDYKSADTFDELMACFPLAGIVVLGDSKELESIKKLRPEVQHYINKAALNPECLQPVIQSAVIQRSVENNRSKEEACYRALVEQIPAITYTLSRDSGAAISYVSPQIAMLGYTQAEWLANPDLWAESLYPEDFERVTREVSRVQAKGESLSIEYRLLTKNNEVVWIHDRAGSIKDNFGKVICYQGVMTNLTVQRQAEEKVKTIKPSLYCPGESKPDHCSDA